MHEVYLNLVCKWFNEFDATKNQHHLSLMEFIASKLEQLDFIKLVEDGQ